MRMGNEIMVPKKLTCIVIGIGSIGKRHIRNLRDILGDDINIVAYKISRKGVGILEKELGIKVFFDIDEAFAQKPDFAVIANPTSLHVEYAIKAAEYGCHLFIEKPISDRMNNIEKLRELVKKRKLITFIPYCLRFSRPILEMKKIMDAGKLGDAISVEVHVGTYLPDWHPKEDYRQRYSAKKALGGGVLLDLSHEIDYARWLFGELRIISAFVGKKSSLEIETEDTADITAESDNGVKVKLHLNYIEKPPKRFCKIVCENGEIYWDNNTKKIEITDNKTRKKEVIDVEEDDNSMYIREMEHFLGCIKNKNETMIPLDDGINTLSFILGAKEISANWNEENQDKE
ncbi:Gfo/Idh/MocA family protein [Nanoarchaeota archaeon]